MPALSRPSGAAGRAALALGAASPGGFPQYIIKTVEVESTKAKQALSESQSRNQYLQEQVGMQRQVLKEMEQQLQSSQKTAAQLRAQVWVANRSSATVVNQT